MGNIESGKLDWVVRSHFGAFAVTPNSRDPNLSDVPTFKELGLNETCVTVGWSAIYGPKNLPKDAVAKWTSTLNSISKDKEWLDATQKLGSVPEIMSPNETKAFVKK
jgi:tripartite-type tricarboxylate transporter receptor subunit TctC